MGSLSVVGEYQILGRCNDIDGVHVYAARKSSDKNADQLFSLHHFPFVNPSAEQELRALVERTRSLDDPILVAPRDIVRVPEGLFMVTDFVAGETIEQIVRSNRAAVSKILAVAIARDVARACERATERTGRAMFGDVSAAQVLLSYDTGDLKVIMIGAPLVQGRSVLPSTKSLGSLLWEMLVGKKLQGTPTPPKGGADLDRIVLNAISYASSEIGPFAEELHNYLRTRTIAADRSDDQKKLIQQYFSHKSTAMRALIQRWRSQTVPRSSSVAPRTSSVPPRAPSVVPRSSSTVPRSSSVTPRSPPPVPPRRSSSIRPVQERGLEAALADPDILILDPEEFVGTEDISAVGLRRTPRLGWPRLRLAFFMFLLSLSCATAALMLMNGEGKTITSGWMTLLSESEQLAKALLSRFR